MSEIKIQSTPAVPQGAVVPLTEEVERKSRAGFAGRQNQMSDAIGRGTQVDLVGTQGPVKPNEGNGAAARPNASVNQMAVAGVGVSVRPVDRRTVEGSTPGDSRQRGADAHLPKNPGPRGAKGQAALSSRQSSTS